MSFQQKEKSKIAILTIKNSYGYGGVLTCVQQVYKFCQKYFDPTVFVLSFDKDISASLKSFKFFSGTKKSEYFGMKCIEIGARWAFWEPGHYVYTLPAWKELLHDYKYFFFKSGSCIAAYPLVQLNKKFVAWVGTSYEDDKAQRVEKLSGFRYLIDRVSASKMRRIEREILQKADVLFSISRNTRKRIEQILGYNRDNLFICGYPLESLRDVAPLLLRANRKGETKQNKNIIAVGRFSDPRKNIEMLLRVFDKLFSKDSELKLFVIGKVPSPKILSKYQNLSSFKNIAFTGPLSAQKMEKYYKSSSLMLLTSYQEGLGIVGLEALSYGIPVVTTDCGGTKDYVIDGQNGYLVKINDDDDMAAKALKILSSPQLHQKMSNFAVEFIEQNFSQNKIYSIFKFGLIKVYPELKDLFEQSKSDDKLDLSKSYDRVLQA